MTYREDIQDRDAPEVKEVIPLSTQGDNAPIEDDGAHADDDEPPIEEVIPLATQDYVIISEIPAKQESGVSYAPVVQLRESSAPSEEYGDPYIGKLILGRYEIQSVIGIGGMGRVYKAYQRNVDRFVAVKILPSGPAGINEQIAKRFHLEARAASALSHPNTITVHDFGQIEDGALCLVMEYLTGKTLEYVIAEKPSVARVLRIALQICGSLSEAHQRGIVHRDLKPPNIIVSAIGEDKDWVKVLDFGIAKLIDTSISMSISVSGTVSGTPEYMSPEQVQGLAVDARSDIYSLGLLIYELITGQAVVNCNTPLACMYAHLHNTPSPFSKAELAHEIPDGLEAVVMKMLAKDTKKRFQSIAELVPVLSDFLMGDVSRRKSNPPLGTGSLSSLLPPQDQLQRSAQKSASTRRPTDELLMLNELAKLYETRNEPEQATETYRKIAAIHMENQNFEASSKALKSGLALSPNDEETRQMIEACFAILDKNRTSGTGKPAGYLSSTPPPGNAPALSVEVEKTKEQKLAARLKSFVQEEKYQQALSSIRSVLTSDPTNEVAIEYAGRIYETVGEDILDQDEVIWLKALLGRPTGRPTETSPTKKASTDQWGSDGEHNLLKIAGGSLDSIFGGTFIVPSFEIQKFPVTNADYKAFIQATGELPPAHWLGNEPPKNELDMPVVGVTIEDARTYARWCEMEIPNTIEWEAAARLPDNRMFPWGNDWNDAYCHCKQNGATAPGPIGSFPKGASHYGCLDLMGNVWEWTEYHDGLKAPDTGYYCVLGGSFRHSCVKNGKIARTDVSENGAYPYLGFRCMRKLTRKRK